MHNPHGGGNTYELERALGEDMLLVSVGWANSYYQQSGDYTDEWGITWKPIEYTTPYGVGSYTEPTGHPLADDEAVLRYTAARSQSPGAVPRRRAGHPGTSKTSIGSSASP